MKKILTICVAVLMAATTVSAKEYTHSLGVVAGSGIGAQYKVMPMEHFTIIEEFGFLGSLCAAGRQGMNFATLGAMNNLVLAYQTGALAEGDGIAMSVFAGGQVKAGYLPGDWGMIGVGAAAGIEANMKNAPIAFSFDFRPGYGCALINNGGGGVNGAHLFDWTLNLGVRYTF